MTEVPGDGDFPFLGDRTLGFAKDSFKFINNHIKNHGRIFRSRLLHRQIIFLASYDSVHQLLNDENNNYGMEYGHEKLWGENVLHYNDKEAARVKAVLGKCLQPDQLPRLCRPVIHNVLENLLGSLEDEEAIPLYTKLKQVASYITVCLFLGLDPGSTAEIESIIELTTEHWHGLISIPFNVSLFGHPSTYSKATEAKRALMVRIEEVLRRSHKNEFNQAMSDGNFKSKEELKNHILLFVSALPPKAVASILASIFIELGKPEHVRYIDIARDDLKILNGIISEVERLHPPFIGGRRQALKACTLSGYTIPKGSSLLYLTHAAHRDPVAFPNPDQFIPERWLNRDTEKETWAFGGGHRSCIGKALMKMILLEIVSYIIKNYDWHFQSDVHNIKYKALPVYRPNEEIYVKFRRRDGF